MSNWWARASTEQRLAQVDAGIELGMTARQVAMASGANTRSAVWGFARNHGRHFPPSSMASASTRRAAAKKSTRAAYFRGEAVDMWRDGVQDRTKVRGEYDEVVLE